MTWKAAVILLTAPILAGCEPPPSNPRVVEADLTAYEARWRADKEARDACVKLGGVPIESAWTMKIARCDFPHTNKE